MLAATGLDFFLACLAFAGLRFGWAFDWACVAWRACDEAGLSRVCATASTVVITPKATASMQADCSSFMDLIASLPRPRASSAHVHFSQRSPR